MRLSHRHPIVRLAYWGGDHVPSRTSLCALFWRCVALSVLKCLLIAMVAPFFYAAVGVTNVKQKLAARRKSDNEREPWRTPREWFMDSGFAEIAHGVKHRICPIVQIDKQP